LILFIHSHHHSELECYSEFVLVDSDFFNQLPDELPVIFRERKSIG